MEQAVDGEVVMNGGGEEGKLKKGMYVSHYWEGGEPRGRIGRGFLQ